MANQTKPKPKLQTIDIKDLQFDDRNPRTHPKENIDVIEHSMREFGAARSIVLDENNMILAGNGATKGAIKAGKQRVIIVDSDGTELIAVRRSNLTEEQKNQLKLVDNRSNETSDWDYEILQELLKEQTPEVALDLGWDEKELTDLLSGVFTDRTFTGDAEPEEKTENETELAEPQDYGQFAVPVTATMEHTIRRGIKKAKDEFATTHSGEALTRLISNWMDKLKDGEDKQEVSN